MAETPTKRILWHDPNIHSKENKKYLQEFFQGIKIDGFDDYEKAAKFLRESQEKWVVITSGQNGLAFVSLIHNYISVSRIILFCLHPIHHQEWVQNYGKIFKVAISFKEVRSAVQVLIEKTDVKGSMEAAGEPVPHTDYKASMTFKKIVRLLSHGTGYLPEHIIDELTLLNPHAKEEIKKDFEKRKMDILKAIFHLYFSIYLHKEINKKLAAQKYDELVYTLAACIQGIRVRSDLQVDKRNILYRGTRYREQQFIYFDDNETVFWPGFISVCQDKKEAEKAAGSKGVVFAIKLSVQNPHPTIKINSLLNKESDIVLFPHFAFKVKNKEASGDRMLILLEQDENNNFLSLDEERFADYWRKIADAEVMPKVQAIVLMLEEAVKQFDICEKVMGCWESFVINRLQEQMKREKDLKQSIIDILLTSASDILTESITNHFKDEDIEGVINSLGINEYISRDYRILIKGAFGQSKNNIMNLSIVKPVLEKYIEKFITKLEGVSESLSEEKLENIQKDALKEMQSEWTAINEYIRAKMKSKLEEIKPEIYEKIKNNWYQE